MAYNARITLRQPAAGEDEAGQATTGWVDVATVWSDPLGLNGAEAIRADAKISTGKCSFRIRPRADVQPGWTVLLGTTVYEVKAVLPDLQRRLHVDLACEVLP